LRGGVNVDAGLGRRRPVKLVGAGFLAELLGRLLVEDRTGRRAEHTPLLLHRLETRLLRRLGNDDPAGALLIVEIDRGREVVDAGLALVGLVALPPIHLAD